MQPKDEIKLFERIAKIEQKQDDTYQVVCNIQSSLHDTNNRSIDAQSCSKVALDRSKNNRKIIVSTLIASISAFFAAVYKTVITLIDS